MQCLLPWFNALVAPHVFSAARRATQSDLIAHLLGAEDLKFNDEVALQVDFQVSARQRPQGSFGQGSFRIFHIMNGCNLF